MIQRRASIKIEQNEHDRLESRQSNSEWTCERKSDYSECLGNLQRLAVLIQCRWTLLRRKHMTSLEQKIKQTIFSRKNSECLQDIQTSKHSQLHFKRERTNICWTYVLEDFYWGNISEFAMLFFFVHAIINKTVNLCCIILHYLECAICAHQTHFYGGSFLRWNKNMNTTKIIFLKFQLFSSHLCALHLIIQKQKPLTNHDSEQKMQGVEMICKRILMKKV